MKRTFTIFVMLLVSSCYVFGVNAYEKAKAGEKQEASGTVRNAPKQEVDVHAAIGPKTVQVYLKRVYLDGQTTVQVQPVTIWSMEDFWARFSEWKIVDQNMNKVIFKKEINDISPLLKTSGYFGLSEDNILTIYKGKPEKDKAIHSFFRIDVKELESELKRELRKGIPVQTKDHYKKVIQSLKPYTLKR